MKKPDPFVKIGYARSKTGLPWLVYGRLSKVKKRPAAKPKSLNEGESK